MIQPFGAIPGVEPPRACIIWLDIHAYAKGSLFDEPGGHHCQQLAGDPVSASLWSDIDPLQFGVAPITPGSMPCHESHHLTVIYRYEYGSRGQGLLW